ncbi:hypothetical protein BDD12DRAFT_886373 [Trichophaea hybrida]|nr:hypothetical protein BDD12DRAFT_886373 [Trichophaea hybrida]
MPRRRPDKLERKKQPRDVNAKHKLESDILKAARLSSESLKLIRNLLSGYTDTVWGNTMIILEENIVSSDQLLHSVMDTRLRKKEVSPGTVGGMLKRKREDGDCVRDRQKRRMTGMEVMAITNLLREKVTSLSIQRAHRPVGCSSRFDERRGRGW